MSDRSVPSQDDTYTESYISTIGVDFVSGALHGHVAVPAVALCADGQ